MTPARQEAERARDWEYEPDTYGLVEDISDALVCREQDHFLLTDADGDIPEDNTLGLGFYARDTRHLNTYTLLINGEKPLVLASSAQSGFSQEQVLGNKRAVYRGVPVGRGTIEMIRRRHISNGLVERLELTNHNRMEVGLSLTYVFEADFKDIFEVRGHERRQAGTLFEPEWEDDALRFRYAGADGVSRSTTLRFNHPPDSRRDQTAGFSLVLSPGQTYVIELEVLTNWGEVRPRESDFDRLRADYATWRNSFAALYTDNDLFNEVLQRCIDDLRTLWTEDGDDGYFAAGLPWYATLFGRDSIITALQVLPFRPDLARRTLRVLARHQGRRSDPGSVQQPGKIVHEVRDSELNVIHELPYGSYFGSVDSTPLFLLLVAEYFAWTADTDTVREIQPAVLDALRWIRELGRRLPDPYLRYETDSISGLRNQGWKDSTDAIMDEDGRPMDGPIALVEVQAYLHAAYCRIPGVLQVSGQGELAQLLQDEAEVLRQRFGRDFWLSQPGRLALALDGAGQPSSVMSSNAGQALLADLLDAEQAEAVRSNLFRNEMFSGWGIRTLASTAPGYFPLGYHLGTVWPHDNALIGVGLKRYGFDAEVSELLTCLFDAAGQFPSRRLPELFGGQPRMPYLPPVPYPVACRPQAWAAGSLLHILRTTLGIAADASRGVIYVTRPRLPYWLQRVHLTGLKVGGGTVDLHFERGRSSTATVSAVARGVDLVQDDRFEGL